MERRQAASPVLAGGDVETFDANEAVWKSHELQYQQTPGPGRAAMRVLFRSCVIVWSAVPLVPLVSVGILSLLIWTTTQLVTLFDAGSTNRALLNAQLCGCLLMALSPVLVAFGYWMISLAVWCAGRHDPVARLFLLTGQVGAGIMGAGALADIRPLSTWGLNFLLLWGAPLLLHFYWRMLRSPSIWGLRRLIGGGYGLALLLTVIGIGLGRADDIYSPGWWQDHWGQSYKWIVWLAFLLALGMSLGLAIWAARHAPTPFQRQRGRRMLFGSLVAFSPAALLSMIPDLAFGLTAAVPYQLTFPFALLYPLTYGALFFERQRPTAIIAIHRTSVYYLLGTVLLGIYVLTLTALIGHPPMAVPQWVLRSGLVSVMLLFLVIPLQRVIQRFTTWVWYDDSIDPLAVVGHLTDALALTVERTALQRLLIDDLPTRLQLSGSALFLPVGTTEFALSGVQGLPIDPPVRLPSDGALVRYLQRDGRIRLGSQLRHALAREPLTAAERALLTEEPQIRWLPLIAGGALQGILLLGIQRTGTYLEDPRLLATLAREAAIAAHNVALTAQLQASHAELTLAHQAALAGREHERSTISHELHDSVVQDLIGISYQLSGMRQLAAPQIGASLEELRQDVLGVVRQIRTLIRELRPAGLEELGLPTALEGYVAQLRREGGTALPQIVLDVDPSRTMLPSLVAMCLFRVAQEALRNALKHAAARQIVIRLHFDQTCAALEIVDDGCGFVVPERLGTLTYQNHFGLVGIAERVGWLGGHMTLVAQPGAGTCIQVWLPLREREIPDDRGNIDCAC